MKLKNVLIVVSDMDRAKIFYKELFGLSVILDSEENVILTEGLVLQEKKVWEKAVGGLVIPKSLGGELYFENYGEPVEYVTRLTRDSNGQSLVRFYDPDGNLIEVRSPA